jgi:16S rRNA (cytosine967-C5)-methyltransferase
VRNTTAPTARFVAADTLCRLYKTRISVKILFERSAKKNNLPARDRSLAMNLVYGVLRQRQILDEFLAGMSRTPLHKLDPFVHQALAVGFYQIFFLERIPHSAVVNEAVNSCRHKGIPKRLHGFVNGILRETIRRLEKTGSTKLPQKDKNGRPIYNHPDWLVNRWISNFGMQETARICEENNLEPLPVLRINRSKITISDFCRDLDRQGIPHLPGTYGTDSLVLTDFHGPLLSLPGYKEGLFQVQDEAAQLASLLLTPVKKNGLYLDGCAGLGGKTAHLAELGTDHNLEIHCVEPDRHRLQLLRENHKRLFADSRIHIHEQNLEDFADGTSLLFDAVLIDAPCSGTGVIGRHPDIRWNRKEEDIARYSSRQLSLLTDAAALTRPGGILVYTTCSLEPEENEEVIRSFLARHPVFILTDCRNCLPKQAEKLVKNKFFQPHPTTVIDGFFGARLQKMG